MASTPASLGSGTLKRESSKKDAGKLGWVGTLTRRMKSENEYEQRSMVEPASLENPKVKELQEVLLDWINDELSELRIALRDITEDLYDGQILAILMEKLANIKLAEFEEVTQLVDSQKAKLSVLLGHVNKLLGIPDHCAKWTANSIHDKNIVAILHLLVALARHFECPRKLTSGVRINLVVVQKKGLILPPQKLIEEITVATEGEHTENGKPEKDAFDALFDNAPEKLNVVKKSLQGFVNKHLNKLSLEVADIDSQFHDGVYLIFLLGLLEGFVVPLYQFYITLSNKDEKLHNVALAIDLMRDSGMKFYAKSEVMEQLDDQLMDLIVDPWLIQETDIDLVFWEDDESIEISDDDTIEISDDKIIEISDDESRSTEDPFLPETITISDDASSSVTVGIGDDLVETILISDDEAEEQETKHLRIILRKIIPTPLQLKRLKNRQKKENKVI